MQVKIKEKMRTTHTHNIKRHISRNILSIETSVLISSTVLHPEILFRNEISAASRPLRTSSNIKMRLLCCGCCSLLCVPHFTQFVSVCECGGRVNQPSVLCRTDNYTHTHTHAQKLSRNACVACVRAFDAFAQLHCSCLRISNSTFYSRRTAGKMRGCFLERTRTHKNTQTH